MEAPIKIIITLFVTIIVATTIIMFTRDVIDDSKVSLKDIAGKEIKDEDKIIESTTVTSEKIGVLAQDCYKRHSGESLEDNVCYVVLGEVNLDVDKVKNNFFDGISDLENVDEGIIVDIEDAKNAVKIMFNPVDNKVYVTS